MKTRDLIAAMVLGVALIATPVYAQSRGGGSRGGSGSHSSASSSRSSSSSSHSSSSSSSRSSYSSSSSSRSSSPSSSSRSSYSSSSSSRSSSPSSSSRSSYSAPSRSNATPAARHSSAPSSSRSSVGRPSSSAPSSSRMERGNSHSTYNTPARESRTGVGSDARGAGHNNGDARRSDRPGRPAAAPTNGDNPKTGGRGTSDLARGSAQYARPGNPSGHMPPSHRPMHPAPYFHHPHHHGMIHMHPIVWVHVPPRPWYWPGFWSYCNSYWYDYHVTDVVVVHNYVNERYNLDMVSYVISGDLMYAIVNDHGTTLLQVYDQNDKLLAEQEISHKYIKTEIDRENGGCWIFKKKDKDPMLFLYVDGELLIYEAD